MATINLSTRNAILPPALANAALLIAAPSLGCLKTYISALTNLCRAYSFPVPDLAHVHQCKQQTDFGQKINLGTMVNVLDLNVVPTDIKEEYGDIESGNYVQEVTCINCNVAHPATDYACPVKQELFEEYTAMYKACRGAAGPNTPGIPPEEMHVAQTKVTISQDQAKLNTQDISQHHQQPNTRGTSQETPETDVDQEMPIAQTKVYFSQDQAQLIHTRDISQHHQQPNTLGTSQETPETDVDREMPIAQTEVYFSQDQALFNVLDTSQDQPQHNTQDTLQETPVTFVDQAKVLSSNDQVFKNQHIASNTTQLGNIITGPSLPNPENSKEQQKKPPHHIFDNSSKSLYNDEHQKHPSDHILDNSYKSQSSDKEYQTRPLHNIFDISNSQSNEEENNNSVKSQSIDKDKSQYSQKDKSQSTDGNKSKSSRKENKQISFKEYDRPPVYHILDNNGKSQSTYSKEKAKNLLSHSLSVTYSNSIKKPSDCKVYVSTIRNGLTRIPWLHLEYIKAGGHKSQKHIPFSKICKIAIWKDTSIRISYTSSENELTKGHFLCLQVTKHKNNKRILKTLHWLRSFLG